MKLSRIARELDVDFDRSRLDQCEIFPHHRSLRSRAYARLLVRLHPTSLSLSLSLSLLVPLLDFRNNAAHELYFVQSSVDRVSSA